MAMLSMLLYKAASDSHWHEAVDFAFSRPVSITDAVDRCAVATVLGYYRRSCKLPAERAEAYHIGRAAREEREARPASLLAVRGAIMALGCPHVDSRALARAIKGALGDRSGSLSDGELRTLLRYVEDRAPLLVQYLAKHGILCNDQELLASWEDVSPDQPLLLSVVRYFANRGALTMLEVHYVDHVMLRFSPEERRVILSLLFMTNPEAAVEAIAKRGMAEDDPTVMLYHNLMDDLIL